MMRGEFVRIRRKGDDGWTRGMVTLASENGKSIVIMMDGAVHAGDGVLVGVVPLSVDNGVITGLFFPDEYEVEILKPDA